MKLRYSNFYHLIDVDAFEEAIGFEPIERLGEEDRGFCPLPWDMHKNGDTTGKFSINREKKVYGCWVCGGGSLLSLAMAMKEMDDQEATDWLHQFVGPETDTSLSERVSEIFNQPEEKEKALPYYGEKIIEKWVSPFNPWFLKRGITPDIAEEYKLGWSSEMIRHAPRQEGKTMPEPYVGEALIFPHFWQARLMGWQIRWLAEDRPKWLPKYTNTADFPKKETLFNYEKARTRAEPPIVVESVPTALFLESQGHSAIATFGSSVTEEQMRYLRGFHQGILVSPDNDKAGEEFLERLKGYLYEYIPVKLVIPPEGEGADLGDLVNDTEQLDKLLEEAFLI